MIEVTTVINDGFGYTPYTTIKDNQTKISELWNNTAYPLQFSVEVDEFDRYVTRGLIEFVKTYIYVKTGSNCSIETIKYNNPYIISLYPLIEDDYIYVDEYTVGYFDADLNRVVGFGAICPSLLSGKLQQLNNPTFLGETKSEYDVLLYKLNIYNKIPDIQVGDRIDEIISSNERLIYEGITAISKIPSIVNIIGIELSHVWLFNTTNDRNNDLMYYKCVDSLSEEKCQFNNWLNDSIHRIIHDKPPLVRWVVNDDASRTILYYCSIMSIIECSKVNSYMIYCKDELYIDQSNIIYIPVWGPDDLLLFKKVFRMYISNASNYHVHYIDDPNTIEEILKYNHQFDAIRVYDKIVSTSEVLLYKYSDTDYSIDNDDVMFDVVDYGNIFIEDNVYYVQIDNSIHELVSSDVYDKDMDTNVRESWKSGSFLTHWGGYLKDKHNIVSALIVKEKVNV